jgi:hypothetical protein
MVSDQRRSFAVITATIQMRWATSSLRRVGFVSNTKRCRSIRHCRDLLGTVALIDRTGESV